MAVFIPIVHVLGIATALHAILYSRTSQAAFAWAIGLVGFPYLALPLYWVFGRSRFQGYLNAFRSTDEKVRAKLALLDERLNRHHAELTGDEARFLVVEKLAHAPFTSGHSTELLIDGEATFGSIFEGIESAKDYILVEFYILRDDDIGRQLQKRLIEKAKQGVRVAVAYDDLASHGLSEEYKNELRAVGAQVLPFKTNKGWWNRFQLNFRNHRKIVVVDGRLGFIGGLNVGDEYLGKGPLGPWRDTHLRLEGPSVLSIQLAWVQDWFYAGGEMRDLNWEPVPAPDGSKNALVLPMGPADGLATYSSYVVHAIHNARERVWIASPYFVPDEPVIRALQLAGLRGVDVRVMMPENADSRQVQLAAFAFFERLGAAGVRFFFRSPGFMHQKVVLIDHDLASVGTANFDNRSFRLNFEIIAVVPDRGFAADVERMLENDFTHCRAVEKQEYTGRSLWFRLQVRVAYLLSQLM